MRAGDRSAKGGERTVEAQKWKAHIMKRSWRAAKSSENKEEERGEGGRRKTKNRTPDNARNKKRKRNTDLQWGKAESRRPTGESWTKPSWKPKNQKAESRKPNEPDIGKPKKQKRKKKGSGTRKPKAEGRKPKAENRKPKTERIRVRRRHCGSGLQAWFLLLHWP